MSHEVHRQQVREARAGVAAADELRATAVRRCHAAIAAALKAGVPPSTVEDDTGYDASYIRGIRKEAGLPPATRGQARKR